MGVFLASTVVRVPLGKMPQSTRAVLAVLCNYADDTDDSTKDFYRGGNSFPAVTTVMAESGSGRTTVKNAIRELKKSGIIREKATSRYVATYSGSYLPTSPTCYEINLSMLSRLIDVTAIIKNRKLAHKSEEYNALLEAAMILQEDDWDTRVWTKEYQPEKLNWDGTVPGAQCIFSNTTDNDIEDEPEAVSDDDIEEYSNTYRVEPSYEENDNRDNSGDDEDAGLIPIKN